MGQDERDIAEVMAKLYALPPEEFTAARDAEAAARRGPVARQIRRLRRPTLSAWLVNLLAAHRADELDELLAIGERLRDAHRAPRGGELRELSTRRQAVITSLLSLARDLAAEHGKQIREETVREAESTLGAALADPDVADQVRAGVLVKPASYSGLGVPDGWALPEGEAADSAPGPQGGKEAGKEAGAPGRAAAEQSEAADYQGEPAGEQADSVVRRGRARLRVILGGRGEQAPAEEPRTPARGKKSAAGRAATQRPTELAAEREQRLRAALAQAEQDLDEAGAAERQAARRLGEIAAELDELRIRERQLRAEQAEVDRDRRRSQRRRQAAEKAVADARRRLR